MPKHIASGLKYLAAIELKKKGFNQQLIADELEIDRSTVSHYLNGRNLSWNSIDVAKTVTSMCPKDFLIMTQSLFKDTDKTRKIVSICKNNEFEAEVADSCIACGLCVDLCLMKAVSLNSLKAQIDSICCCGCLLCKEGCPTNSIKILEVKNDREYERG
ncbi:ferredoxin [Methanobrevibacter cuticularis]|uniref:Ferredoxin n=1 Tax=Methanobrevibacter cuticularis TaxID=47311 RepID=A0A166DF70_9EURY|nr:tRNA CCA-pyrophosphorylase [Methanobrevibacter cuticularis]KZX15532.1 ferredoxin [Methanobrevibacter cuticularis]